MADRFPLYVEGADDCAVICQVGQYHNFLPFRVIDRDPAGQRFYGLDDLKRVLPVRLKAEDFDRLGVVVDADLDLSSRWQSLRDIFANAGYSELPRVPDPDGTVVDHSGLPRVGVWIMPHNVSSGMLEDFVRDMIPQSDTLLDRAKNCLDHIPANERRFSPQHHAKAWIHTWLAWQEVPGSPQGLAISRRYLDPTCPGALKLLGWLTRLFA